MIDRVGADALVQDEAATNGGTVDDLEELKGGIAFHQQAVRGPDGAGVHRDPENDKDCKQRTV